MNKFARLILVGITFDRLLVTAIKELFLGSNGCKQRQWEGASLDMCRGEIGEVVQTIASANVIEFRFSEHHLGPPPTTPFEILDSANLRNVSFENVAITEEDSVILQNYLSTKRKLDTFDISYGRVAPEAVEQLARGLQCNISLRTFSEYQIA